MSLIISLTTLDNVIMGADSGTYDLDSGIREPSGAPKIFRQSVTREEEGASLHFLVGCTGSTRQREVLQHAFRPPNPYTRENFDLTRYMVVHYAGDVRSYLDDHNALGDEHPLEGSAIIAVYGTGKWNSAPRVYELQSDLGLSQPDSDWNATGAGYQVALGAVTALDLHGWTKSDPEGTIRAVLGIAGRYSLFCHEPYHTARLIED